MSRKAAKIAGQVLGGAAKGTGTTLAVGATAAVTAGITGAVAGAIGRAIGSAETVREFKITQTTNRKVLVEARKTLRGQFDNSTERMEQGLKDRVAELRTPDIGNEANPLTTINTHLMNHPFDAKIQTQESLDAYKDLGRISQAFANYFKAKGIITENEHGQYIATGKPLDHGAVLMADYYNEFQATVAVLADEMQKPYNTLEEYEQREASINQLLDKLETLSNPDVLKTLNTHEHNVFNVLPQIGKSKKRQVAEQVAGLIQDPATGQGFLTNIRAHCETMLKQNRAELNLKARTHTEDMAARVTQGKLSRSVAHTTTHGVNQRSIEKGALNPADITARNPHHNARELKAALQKAVPMRQPGVQSMFETVSIQKPDLPQVKNPITRKTISKSDEGRAPDADDIVSAMENDLECRQIGRLNTQIAAEISRMTVSGDNASDTRAYFLAVVQQKLDETQTQLEQHEGQYAVQFRQDLAKEYKVGMLTRKLGETGKPIPIESRETIVNINTAHYKHAIPVTKLSKHDTGAIAPIANRSRAPGLSGCMMRAAVVNGAASKTHARQLSAGLVQLYHKQYEKDPASQPSTPARGEAEEYLASMLAIKDTHAVSGFVRSFADSMEKALGADASADPHIAKYWAEIKEDAVTFSKLYNNQNEISDALSALEDIPLSHLDLADLTGVDTDTGGVLDAKDEKALTDFKQQVASILEASTPPISSQQFADLEAALPDCQALTQMADKYQDVNPDVEKILRQTAQSIDQAKANIHSNVSHLNNRTTTTAEYEQHLEQSWQQAREEQAAQLLSLEADHEKVVAELGQKEEELDQLTEERAEIVEQITSIKEKFEDPASLIDDITGELDSARQLLDRLDQTITATQTAQTQLKADYQSLTTEMIGALQSSANDWGDEKSKVDAQLKILKSELDAGKQAIEAQSNKLISAAREENPEKCKQVISQALEIKQQRMESLEQRFQANMAACEANLEHLKKNKESLETQIGQFKERISSLDAAHQGIINDLDEASRDISTLVDLHDELKTEVAALKEEITAIKIEINTLHERTAKIESQAHQDRQLAQVTRLSRGKAFTTTPLGRKGKKEEKIQEALTAFNHAVVDKLKYNPNEDPPIFSTQSEDQFIDITEKFLSLVQTCAEPRGKSKGSDTPSMTQATSKLAKAIAANPGIRSYAKEVFATMSKNWQAASRAGALSSADLEKCAGLLTLNADLVQASKLTDGSPEQTEAIRTALANAMHASYKTGQLSEPGMPQQIASSMKNTYTAPAVAAGHTKARAATMQPTANPASVKQRPRSVTTAATQGWRAAAGHTTPTKGGGKKLSAAQQARQEKLDAAKKGKPAPRPSFGGSDSEE